MTAPRCTLAGRTARLAFGAVLAMLLLTPAGAGAEEAPAPDCHAGTSLVPRLRADGRLEAIEAEAAETPNGEGRLWRIEREGRAPSFLFGTMHLSDPRILALPEPVAKARQEAATVVIETLDVLDEVKSNGLLLAHPELMMLAPGKTLGQDLQEGERRDLEAQLLAKGMPYASIQTLQPWFTAMGLMLPSCEAARIAGGAQPLDVRIALDAKGQGQEVAGLESALEQLRTMASMPMELQMANLLAVLKMDGEIPDLFETMTEFYLDGRMAAITPLSESVLPPDATTEALEAQYSAFETRIVTDRNHRMAERLGPYLEKGGAFVAVGALHLPGAEGLVELLRADNYRVTRVE